MARAPTDATFDSQLLLVAGDRESGRSAVLRTPGSKLAERRQRPIRGDAFAAGRLIAGIYVDSWPALVSG
jgi:hypothetical protein